MTNLIGGWLVTALLMAAFPALRQTAIEVAGQYIGLGTTWRAFALAVVGGMLITLMTHLQHTTESDGVRLVPAVIVGTILSVGHVNHAIVASLACFAALVAGAPFGYADWGGMVALAIVGNLIGGLALVTVLRLLQLPHKVIQARGDDRGRADVLSVIAVNCWWRGWLLGVSGDDFCQPPGHPGIGAGPRPPGRLWLLVGT